jgi:hypothetical protein
VLGPSSHGSQPIVFRPMPTKKMYLQVCRSAAAESAACSPHKTWPRTYLRSKRSWGLDPRDDPRRKQARCAPRLRPGLRTPLPATRVRVRGLGLHGTCQYTMPPGKNSTRRHHGGQTVEEREGWYISRNKNLSGSSAPSLPQIALPMASSNNDHSRGAHGRFR